MNIFMLGWEFPPHISGGLGTACHGLTRGLDELGVDVIFVLPTSVPIAAESHVRLRSPSNIPQGPARRRAAGAAGGGEAAGVEEEEVFEHVRLRQVAARLQAYAQPQLSEEAVRELIRNQREVLTEAGATEEQGPVGGNPAVQEILESAAPSGGSFVQGPGAHYAGDLMSQIHRYARLAVEIALREEFDLVHAHDWMTYPAGLAVAAATGKPLIVHVHSTEFDRSGENVNQQVYDIERTGMHGAAKVVCVSHLTRKIVETRYGVPADRLEVVYNAVELPERSVETAPIRQNEKIVLFLGRLTMQKGPEYFLQAAKKVVEKFPDVRFVVAGSGDMISRCIQLAADLRIGRYVTFTGFLRGADVDRVFEMADLYVMPSVSEPFGISPLEALSHNVPAIISKQSGVSEVLTHVLKVDFWDTDEMANKILAVLRHAPLQKTLRQHGQIDVRRLSWTDSARRLKEVYESVLPANGG